MEDNKLNDSIVDNANDVVNDEKSDANMVEEIKEETVENTSLDDFEDNFINESLKKEEENNTSSNDSTKEEISEDVLDTEVKASDNEDVDSEITDVKEDIIKEDESIIEEKPEDNIEDIKEESLNESENSKVETDIKEEIKTEEVSEDNKSKDIVKVFDLINDADNKDNVKAKLDDIREWILQHSKLVMPVFLILCILLTVLIALNANRKDKLQKAAINKAMEMSKEENTSADIPVLTAPEVELKLNEYPEINGLVNDYYLAQANGDIDSISKKNSYLNDIEKLRIEQLAKYINSYTEVNVYTKPGLAEDTYVAYVCSKVKFNDYDTPLPGMQTYYIFKDDAGNYSINDGTYDETVYEYIKEVTVQDDVVDLNNKVVVEYNDLLANDPDLSDFIVYIKGIINEEVGELLAEDEVPADSIETENVENTEPVVSIVTKVKAKESVNIRKSDSKDADRLGTARVGEEFTLIEKKANGWTEVEYNGQSAFINSDYLVDVDEVVVEVPGVDDNTQETDNTTDTNTNTNTTTTTDTKKANETSTNTTVTGKVKVNTSGVRIRKEPNTDSEVLATVYVGEKLEFIEKANDWSKIKYKDMTGYIKSEYVNEVE